ncbi:hypothetical protein K1719_015762 [Acacia pycnantha]|nr:hypothetical protein K1719_015762 [Acacia pycnantha]
MTILDLFSARFGLVKSKLLQGVGIGIKLGSIGEVNFGNIVLWKPSVLPLSPNELLSKARSLFFFAGRSGG